MSGEITKKVTFKTGAVAQHPANFRRPESAEPYGWPGGIEMLKMGVAGLSMFAGGTASATTHSSAFASWEPKSGSTEVVKLGSSEALPGYDRLEKRLTQLEARSAIMYRSLASQMAALVDRAAATAWGSLEETGAGPVAVAARVAELSHSDTAFSRPEWAECLDAIADAQLNDSWLIEIAGRAIRAPDPLVRAAAARVLAHGGSKDSVDLIAVALEMEGNPFARKVMESAARSAHL
ncbi:MAG: hypothetical protein QOJ91_216 [Sphingomonadales bacterium]|jgi:hypothetical protein|nr:hypothetical protein [Sphingomonadales bacterium]